MSFLSIDDGDRRPPYEQLSSQLVRLIASGELQPGDRIASIRQLAADLGIAANTVARSYRELEQLGLIVSRGRRGTVVADRSAEIAELHQVRTATALITGAIEEAGKMGLSATDIAGIVEVHAARLRQTG